MGLSTDRSVSGPATLFLAHVMLGLVLLTLPVSFWGTLIGAPCSGLSLFNKLFAQQAVVLYDVTPARQPNASL